MRDRDYVGEFFYSQLRDIKQLHRVRVAADMLAIRADGLLDMLDSVKELERVKMLSDALDAYQKARDVYNIELRKKWDHIRKQRVREENIIKSCYHRLLVAQIVGSQQIRKENLEAESAALGAAMAAADIKSKQIHDLDAEAAVLGAVLLSNEAFNEVADILKPKHFYSDNNRRIFEAVLELKRMQRAVDVISVANFLKDKNRLQQVGGTAYLAHLTDAMPFVAIQRSKIHRTMQEATKS